MLPGDHPSGPRVAARLERPNPSRHRRFSGRNEQFLIRDLFDLAPRRDCHVSPSLPKAVRLVSAALVLVFRPAGVTRYAALRSSDFPPLVVDTRGDRPACLPPILSLSSVLTGLWPHWPACQHPYSKTGLSSLLPPSRNRL